MSDVEKKDVPRGVKIGAFLDRIAEWSRSKRTGVIRFEIRFMKGGVRDSVVTTEEKIL